RFLPRDTFNNLLGMGSAFGLENSFFNIGPTVSLEEARSLYKRAGESLRNHQPQPALADYHKIEHAYRTLHPLVQLHEPEAYASLNQEGKAQNLLKQVVASHKKDSFALLACYELARSHFRANQLDEAKNAFLQVIQMDPKSNLALGSQYYLGELSRATKNEKQ